MIAEMPYYLVAVFWVFLLSFVSSVGSQNGRPIRSVSIFYIKHTIYLQKKASVSEILNYFVEYFDILGFTI